MNLREQINQLLKDISNRGKDTNIFRVDYFKKRYNLIYNDILNWKFPNDFKFSQKLYHYLNEDKELKLGICECGNRCAFLSVENGYRDKCISCREKYRVKNIKSTKKKRYGDENYTNRERARLTCLEKYGVEHYSQTDECKNSVSKKIKNKTPIEKEKTQEKRIQSKKEKYGSLEAANENFRKKYKETNLEKYGVEHYSQTDECKEKSKQTSREKFGTDYYTQTNEFKERYKETCLDKYGVEYYTQTGWYIDKAKETCLEKYGKESFTQTEGYLKKSYETKKKNNSFNSSSIEKEFADWLTKNNIKFESQYRSEEYPFCCDFYLNDYELYIEIQGNWTHGKHPFDENNEEDRMIVEKWKSKNNKFYVNAINTWTIRDVEKREIAKENNLNFLEIFSCKLEDCILSLNRRIEF